MEDRDAERKALFLILTTFVYASPERRIETYGAVAAVIRRCHDTGLLNQDCLAETELMQLYMNSLSV